MKKKLLKKWGGKNEYKNKRYKRTGRKRLKDFQRIAENWDKLPERAQGKIDGIISMAASVFLDSMEKKAGWGK